MIGDKPAFPVEGETIRSGLTKREYIAMHFLAARLNGLGGKDPNQDSAEMAKKAVERTDALLAELAKRGDE